MIPNHKNNKLQLKASTVVFQSRNDLLDLNFVKHYYEEIVNRLDYFLPKYETKVNIECRTPSLEERLSENVLKVEKQMAQALEWKSTPLEKSEQYLEQLSKWCAVVYFILKDGTIRMWNGFYICYHILITPNVNFQHDFTLEDVEIILVNTRTHIRHVNVKDLINDEETFQSVDMEVSGNFLVIATRIRLLSGGSNFKEKMTMTLHSPKWCYCIGHSYLDHVRFCSLSIIKALGCIYQDVELSLEGNQYFGTYKGCREFLPGSLIAIFDRDCEMLGVGMHVGKVENVNSCLLLDENVKSVIVQMEKKNFYENHFNNRYSKL